MWEHVATSVEAILGHIALIITGIGAVWLALREVLKQSEKKTPGPPIVQGQPVQPDLVALLQEDAAEADQLRPRLQKALIRLAENGLPTDDI